ncbi:MAG: 3-oxoacyl-ACP reductase FabG [Gammaproteobacteria bacterium]|nr:3-oxoacyl-ACP reductase FabG [Gammaproteobacteria bacterium]MBU1440991.1 3-oxoacyl-ACP reductase FabG [Gammaproteobacteria bacterium]MBU2285652.1 3-oxoacyl-ACP reductase FabG [Gammaproteobacteria bacterium]
MSETTSRVALVTGAAQGIGRAIAHALGAEGHRVVWVDRNADAVESAVAGLDPSQHLSLVADLRDAQAPTQLQRAVNERWGDVSILVNCAGVPSSKRSGLAAGLLELSDAEWADVIDINLGSAFRMCRQFVGPMAEHGWGRVIQIASMAGRTRSIVASSNYMASKAGLIALTRSIAAEFGPRGVTANAIAPGLVRTPMAAERPAGANETVVAQIPVGRMGTPEEIGAASVYLSGELAGFVNGAVLDINGGVFMA